MKTIKQKIQETKQKVADKENEAIRIAKEKEEKERPLITKDDLVSTLREVVNLANKETEESLLDLQAKQEVDNQEIVSKIEGKISGLSRVIDEMQNTIKSLEIPDTTPLASKEELKTILSQIEGVKSLIPKEKEITTKDIKGLGELLNSLAQPTSQPLTIDILSSGNLIKSGATKLNFPGATITTEGNTTTIIPAAGTTSWGAITGTLSNQTDLQAALDAKQDTLVSGANIKTVNGVTILGAGDIPLPNGTSIQTVTADMTIPLSDGTTVILVDASAGPVNISMPSTTANTGQYTVKKVDTSSNIVTVIGVINGFISPTIDFENESWTMVSTGTEFEII